MTTHRVAGMVVLALVALASASCTSNGASASRSTSMAPTTTTPPFRSPGCDAASPKSGRTMQTLESGGTKRTFARYIPTGTKTAAPVPLIVDITPYSPETLEEGFSGFTTPDTQGKVFADRVGAVVITPEPVNGAGSLLTWNYVGTKGWTDDVTFFTDLLDRIEATTCIDTRRVLVTGFAVGGVMASIVACNLSTRVSVLATVSGLYNPEGCAPKRPIPVVSFHGTGDQFIPFDGGVGPGAQKLGLSPETTSGLVFMATRPGALASSKAWAAHNGCAADAKTIQVSKDLQHLTWPGCKAKSAVELYVIDNGQHTWPGSNGMGAVESLLGPTNDAVDATNVIWTFFMQHTKKPSG